MPALRIVMLIAVLLLSGCKKEKADPTVSTEGPEKTTEAAASETKEEGHNHSHSHAEGSGPDWAPPTTPRDSLKGNYVLAMVGQPVAIFQIDPADKDAPVKLVNFNQRALENEQFRNIPQIKSVRVIGSKVDDKQLQFEFSTGPLSWDFEGRVHPMTMKGNMLVAGSQVVPGELIATSANQVKQEWQPSNINERAPLFQAAEALQKKNLEPFKTYLKDHVGSSVSVAHAFPALFNYPGLSEIPTTELKSLGDLYVKGAREWGPRSEAMAHLTLSGVYINSPRLLEKGSPLIDEATAQLAAAEKLFVGKSEKSYGPSITALKARLDFNRTLAKVRWGTDAEKAEAVGKLKEQRKKPESRWNPQVIAALATHAETQGNLDEAIDLYTTTIAVPGMEQFVTAFQQQGREGDQEPVPPAQALERLWKKKHGSDAGLKQHVAGAYQRELASFDGPKQPPRQAEEGNRVVLVELFTGSECPPCVGADLALGSIERSYSSRDVVILRYHEHIPGPDPLTNRDSEARFGYYNLQSTPSVLLNGRPVSNAGGYAFHVPLVIDNLQKAISMLLKQKTELSLDLQAKQEKDEIKISVDVKGLSKDADDLRLRVVLAEDELEYLAGNGVRKHEMVVRQMPTKPIGVRPDKEKLGFTKTVKISEIKQGLNDYLAAYEEGSEQKFRARPMELQKLSVIAFVQNERTREVLQARMIRLSEPEAPATKPVPMTKPMTSETPKPAAAEASGIDETMVIEAPKP